MSKPVPRRFESHHLPSHLEHGSFLSAPIFASASMTKTGSSDFYDENVVGALRDGALIYSVVEVGRNITYGRHEAVTEKKVDSNASVESCSINITFLRFQAITLLRIFGLGMNKLQK